MTAKDPQKYYLQVCIGIFRGQIFKRNPFPHSQLSVGPTAP